MSATPSEPLFLVADVGTTGAKVGFVTPHGRVVATGYYDYDLVTRVGGVVEQDPDAWWHGLCRTLRPLLSTLDGGMRSVVGVGLCGQMHSLVCLDATGAVIRPAIIWMDQRSEPIVRRMRSMPGVVESVRRCTGNFVANTYTAPKLAWLAAHEPQTVAQASNVVLAKDYVKYRLTGELVTDYSDAAGTLLYDTTTRRWSAEMAELFKVRTDALPALAESSEVIGAVTTDASRASGLPAGIPVINGAADHTCHSLGAGLYRRGQASVQVGTSGSIHAYTDRPVVDPHARIVCWDFCLPRTWDCLGLTQTAGRSVAWLREAVFPGTGDEQFYAWMDDVAERGDTTMVFLPYLNGERSPLWSADCRGAFWNVDINHGRDDFLLAVLEGVAFSLRDNLDAVRDVGLDPGNLTTLGGIVRSPPWLRILAGILGEPMTASDAPHTGLKGVAVLLALGLGYYDDPASAVARIADTASVPVDPKEVLLADEKYRMYRQVREKLVEDAC